MKLAANCCNWTGVSSTLVNNCHTGGVGMKKLAPVKEPVCCVKFLCRGDYPSLLTHFFVKSRTPPDGK